MGFTRVESIARSLGLEVSIQEASRTEDFVGALDALAAVQVAAVDVLASAILYTGRRRIVDRVQALGLPTIYFWADIAREGGLIGFGPNLDETDQLLAQQLVRVLRGARAGRPSDYAAEQVRTRRQSKDRSRPWPDDPGIGPCSRR